MTDPSDTRARFAIGEWIALLVICASTAGCDSFLFRSTPPADDEAQVRRELRVPLAASLRSLSAEPRAPGTFGREGLRIVARFDVPAARRDAVAATLRGAGWSQLPLPDTSSFRAPPTELPAVTDGLGFCLAGVYVVGETFTPHACSELPGRFDHYRAGVFDQRSGLLTVVLKNYY